MSKRMNWRSARLAPKRSASVVDEREYRGQDAAARWLERNEKKPPKSGRLIQRGKSA